METIKKDTKVKDSIYIPTTTVNQVATMAKELGLSKNDIYARAVDEYYKRMPELLQAEIDRQQARKALFESMPIPSIAKK